MQSLLNLVSIRSSDGELDDVHNTTILYSMNDNKYPSLETLEEAFNDESCITFVDYCHFRFKYTQKHHQKIFTKGKLDELLLQSVLGKNLRRHQPFDHDEDFKLSSDDPRPISDQGVQNVLAHWIPHFIIDSFHDLVLDGAKDTHTLTYKDTGTVLAPTLARHIEEMYELKSNKKTSTGKP